MAQKYGTSFQRAKEEKEVNFPVFPICAHQLTENTTIYR